MLLTLLACNGSPDDSDPQADGPTFYEDVAPILSDNCWSCHQSGEIAPFTLTSFEDTQLVASAVADSVAKRRMPPWLATDDGSCNDYQHSVWLEQDDIDTIVEWATGAQLEGDPANQPALPESQASLEDYTHSLPLTDVYLPDFASGKDDYRCFIIDPGLTQDGFLASYEIVAGNPQVVHHVIVYVPNDEGALADAYALDDQDPGDGYSCFGSANVSSYMSAVWAPGRNVWTYPEGTGVPLEAGMPHIMQVHYNDTGSEQGDTTEVRYKIVDSVEGQLYPWFLVNSDIAIPPGEENHQEKQTVRIGSYIVEELEGVDVPDTFELTAVGPHMHQIGSALRASVKTGDEETCLIDVPRWDFNWQFAYEFETPVSITPDSRVTLECDYDSTDNDQTVYWGDGTQDEMCLLTMFSVFY